jgi:hypothetical protein
MSPSAQIHPPYAGDSSSSNITRPGSGEKENGNLKELLVPYPARPDANVGNFPPRVNSAGV